MIIRGTIRMAWVAVVAASIASALFAADVAEAATKKPDLVVKSLGGVPGTLERGATAALAVTTQNKGKATSKASETRLYFSADRKVSASDTRATKSQKVKKLKPRKSAKATVAVTAPQSLALGTTYLLACADDTKKVKESSEGNNCKASSSLQLRALSSDELIDEAKAAGQISEEEALEYHIFAAFFDDRLPDRFAGAPSSIGHSALDEVTDKWDTLSADAKAILGPFLIPPFHEGSYWQPAATAARPLARRADDPTRPWCIGQPAIVLEDWHYVEADAGPAAGKIRIWYQDRYAATDAAVANSLMTTMETKIWPNLTTLMGREPLPDFGSTVACEGGSDALDIALVDTGTASTFSHSSNEENTTTRMLFPRTAAQAGWAALEPYLAHEFMHMIQYSYTFSNGDMLSAQNRWLREGTAQWVQDWVTDSHYGIGIAPQQTEHQPLPIFFDNPDVPVDTDKPPANHDYSSYVFFLWAVRNSNNPGVIKQFWDGVASQKSINAVKGVFAGAWNQTWKDFTKTNWNQRSIDKYQSWDGIANTPASAEGTLQIGQTPTITTQVKHASAEYMSFIPGNGVDFFKYQNNAIMDPEAGIQAIIAYKNNGGDDILDLTQQATESIPVCGVEKVTFVLSNASVDDSNTRDFNFQLRATVAGQPRPAPRGTTPAPTCEPEPLQGTFTGSATFSDAGLHWDLDWSGSMEFEPFSPVNGPPPYTSEIWQRYRATQGSVLISGQITADNGCVIDIPSQTVSYDSTDIFGPNDGFGYMDVQPGTPAPETPVKYTILLEFPGYPGTVTATETCPDQPPLTGPFPMSGLKLVYTENLQQTTVPQTYSGSTTFATQGANYTWSFFDGGG